MQSIQVYWASNDAFLVTSAMDSLNAQQFYSFTRGNTWIKL